MRNVTFVKRRGFKWDDGSAEASFPVSELAQRCVGKYLDLLGSTEGSEYSIPSKTLQDEILRLSADDDATQEDYDAFNDKVSSYADTLSEQELIDWYTDLNDSNTIISTKVTDDYMLKRLPDKTAPFGGLQRRWTVLNEDGNGWLVSWLESKPIVGGSECMAFPYADGAVVTYAKDYFNECGTPDDAIGDMLEQMEPDGVNVTNKEDYNEA